MKEIDLAATPREVYGGGESPLAVAQTSEPEERKIYPKFRYSGDQELDLPESGTMEIEFKKVMELSSVKDGKHHYECEIEVRKITDVDDDEPEAPARSYDESGDALDKLAKENYSDEDKD